MFFRIEPDDIHLTAFKHDRHLHLSMLLRVVRGVVGFVEDVELDLLGRPMEEERKRPVGRDARLPGLKEDIGFQVSGLVEPGRELALGPRGHLGVDEEAGLTSRTESRARVFSTLSHSRIRIYDHFSLDIGGPQLYTEVQSIEGVAPAMRYIEDPRQERLFDPFQGLFPPLARRILENGWQGTFRLAILESLPVAKLSEHFHPSLGTRTKELYSMAGLVFLADFHGWTALQAIEAYMLHTDVQFALNVEPGVQVCTRTLGRYQELFREDDLARLTFENVTEVLVEKLEQDVSLQRLDSTHVFSHMATFGRTKLMAVAIKRFLVQVKRHDPQAYAALPEPLRLRYDLAQSQLFGDATDAEARQRSRQQAAEDLLWVIEYFADQPTMTGRQSYKALLTIFSQQCEVVEGKV